MARRHNFQTFSWFYDLWSRQLLDLDPPYQRRSVWNQAFKDYFVDTVLLAYPSPALFLFEDITPDGRSLYHVVDGKQRLTTLIDFVQDAFPVSERSQSRHSPGTYFSSLSDPDKKAFWGYQFLVEYIPTDDENIINAIFDRINRNVAKLTPQELRHAKLDGEFIATAETLADWMAEVLPRNFPRFAPQSRKQMKDVEFVALLLLLIEEGPKSYSQDDLDRAFSDRDAGWDSRHDIEGVFRQTISTISGLIQSLDDQQPLLFSRLRNQADFYSLVGAIAALGSDGNLAPLPVAALRLIEFVQNVENEVTRAQQPDLVAYYDAARSASNDKGPRETRIAVIRRLLAE